MQWPGAGRDRDWGPLSWSQVSAVSCEGTNGAQLWLPPPALLFAKTIRSSPAEFKKSSWLEACALVRTRDGWANTIAQRAFMTSYNSVWTRDERPLSGSAACNLHGWQVS